MLVLFLLVDLVIEDSGMGSDGRTVVHCVQLLLDKLG